MDDLIYMITSHAVSGLQKTSIDAIKIFTYILQYVIVNTTKPVITFYFNVLRNPKHSAQCA